MPVKRPTVRKITISLPGDLVQYADETARRRQTNRSQIISQVLAEARAREMEQLAAEGYRFYAQEAAEFAQGSAAAVAEALTAAVGEGEGHDGQTG